MDPPTTHAPLTQDRPNRLLFFTTVSACDGTLATLAATGVLTHLMGSVAAGLTAIAGAGAWLAARDAYAGRRRTRRDTLHLLRTAATTTVAALLATYVGLTLGSTDLHILPKSAGLALLLVALEVAGARLPRLRRIPLPLALIALAIPLEVLHHWR